MLRSQSSVCVENASDRAVSAMVFTAFPFPIDFFMLVSSASSGHIFVYFSFLSLSFCYETVYMSAL